MKLPDLSKNCGICGTPIAPPSFDAEHDMFLYLCPVCGGVRITDLAVRAIIQNFQETKHLLSGFTRERTELGLSPIPIRSANIKDLTNSADIPKNVSDKLDRVLLHLQRKSEYPGQHILVDPAIDYPIAYAKNAEEFNFLFQHMISVNWIQVVGAGGRGERSVVLTPLGWDKTYDLSHRRKISDQVFVAMWFAPETERAYTEGIEKAINDSGFKPLRVDKLEHNNKVCDLIIAEIRKSAFLIADFTGHRGGVYFEAGFALGLGIPVIWLCRKDEIEKAHFDTRQYNHIVWETEADLYQKLLNRINATIIR